MPKIHVLLCSLYHSPKKTASRPPRQLSSLRRQLPHLWLMALGSDNFEMFWLRIWWDLQHRWWNPWYLFIRIFRWLVFFENMTTSYYFTLSKNNHKRWWEEIELMELFWNEISPAKPYRISLGTWICIAMFCSRVLYPFLWFQTEITLENQEKSLHCRRKPILVTTTEILPNLPSWWCFQRVGVPMSAYKSWQGQATFLQENTAFVEIDDVIASSNELTFDEALGQGRRNRPIGGCLVVCCFQLIPWKKVRNLWIMDEASETDSLESIRISSQLDFHVVW